AHDNDTNVLPKEPIVVEPEKPVGSNEVLTNDQPQKTSEPVLQPLNEQLHINLPFIEALAQMPKYVKFLKGLLTNKAKLEEACKIIMNERCSVVLFNKFPSKEKDLRSFTIPCDIGQLHIDNALADLRASISLMPYAMYKKLGLGESKATRMSLELVDRSIQYSRGIIKNMLIKVDKFVLPIDFVILDMTEDSRVPIILGRPFLATARAMIDVLNNKITLRVGDDEVIFDIDKLIKRPTIEDDECYGIDDLDETINEEAQELLANEEPDSFLSRGLEKSIDQSDLECCESTCNDEKNEADLKTLIRRIDSVNMSYPVTQREYAYLHGDKSFPIIISSKLSEEEKISLLQVLDKRKGAIAWKMSDIKGISPSYCTHKILMEDDYKPVIQPQRRLNPKVQDVVKNKIVKLLDSGLIYPISDSSWVSPIYVVPKKGGMTVVLNDNNELIPSRTVTGWRVYIDHRKLNDATRKDHFPLPFIDQMLERLCGNEYYCFLMDFQDSSKYQSSGGSTIFHDMVEDFMEVFMDDFSVFGNSFDCCLANLDRMLARCEETNLVLNWGKCHFMVKEGIVLRHKISGAGIEVDRAKINVIAKLPYPTNVKEVRSFLGHARFYRSKEGAENLAADHLSRLENPDLGTFMEEEITDEFLDEHLMILKAEHNNDEPWYADYVNYIVGKIVPLNRTPEKRRRFFSQVKNYFWDKRYAFKLCSDNVMRRCVTGNEILEILGHHSASITRRKVYESGFYWPNIFKDVKDYVMRCDACQSSGNISSRSEMPQNNIQVCDVFDIWGLDFMGPFLKLKGE
ncbi:DNA-directed DNA polymerase, partial [Tanacetum coccineum]